MGQRYGLNSCRKSQSVRDWHVLCERIIRERALQILVLHLHEHILKVRIEAIYDASDIDPNDDDSDDDLGLGAISSLWHDSLVKIRKSQRLVVQCSTCCRVGGVRESLKTLSTGIFADGRFMDGNSHSGGHLFMTTVRAILLANSQY